MLVDDVYIHVHTIMYMDNVHVHGQCHAFCKRFVRLAHVCVSDLHPPQPEGWFGADGLLRTQPCPLREVVTRPSVTSGGGEGGEIKTLFRKVMLYLFSHVTLTSLQ